MDKRDEYRIAYVKQTANTGRFLEKPKAFVFRPNSERAVNAVLELNRLELEIQRLKAQIEVEQ